MKKQLLTTSLAVLILTLLCALPAAQSRVSRSFQVGAGGSLTLTAGTGDILITSGAGNQVSVDVDGIDEAEMSRLTMDQAGNNIRVDYRPTGSSRRRAVVFRIQVPNQFDLNLRTAGGDVSVAGALTGNIEATTSGGDIRLGDVNGRIQVKTAGGDIRAGSVRGDAKLSTSGGDINLQNADGIVEVATSGGDIVLGDVGSTLTAKTAGGDIRIGNVGGEATVTTAGGNVQVGVVSGSASLKTAGGDIECRGASGQVTARTAGGSLRLLDITGSVEASTAGGDVHAELNPEGQGSSRLTSSGGNVRLALPESARAVVNARIRLQRGWGGWRTRDYQINSDFRAQDQQIDETNNEIRAVYILNGGGERIDVETVNGNIDIVRSGGTRR
jgi:DUF4097 and DUF4098 domain-containing protein YvlB